MNSDSPFSFQKSNPKHSAAAREVWNLIRGTAKITPLRISVEGFEPSKDTLVLDREDFQILAQLLQNVGIEGETAANHSDGLRRLAIWAQACSYL